MDWKDKFELDEQGRLVAKNGETIRVPMTFMDNAGNPLRAWFDACRGKPQDATTRIPLSRLHAPPRPRPATPTASALATRGGEAAYRRNSTPARQSRGLRGPQRSYHQRLAQRSSTVKDTRPVELDDQIATAFAGRHDRG